ncbi:hypothetical protein G6F65_017035 [Rhizopus arrhizus]|nr:hypothetical protein G6F65_017035 [Rhizopus arrhizus]
MAVAEEVVIGPLQGMQYQEAAQPQRGDRRQARLPGHRRAAFLARHGQSDRDHRQHRQHRHQPEHQRPAVMLDRQRRQPGRQRRTRAQPGRQRLDALEPRRAWRDQVHRQPRRSQHGSAPRGHQHPAQQKPRFAERQGAHHGAYSRGAQRRQQHHGDAGVDDCNRCVFLWAGTDLAHDRRGGERDHAVLQEINEGQRTDRHQQGRRNRGGGRTHGGGTRLAMSAGGVSP